MNRTELNTSLSIDAPTSSDRCLRAAIEFVVLLIVAVAPWPDASQATHSRFLLSIGLAVILVLWAIRLVVSRTLSSRGKGPFWCLAGFVLLSVLQTIPMPRTIIAWTAPGIAEMQSYYLPPEQERLPGELPSATSAGRSLSISLGDTYEFLTGALALCIFYAAVLHNTVSAGAFRRLAWVCVINGVLISLLAFALRISHERVLFWPPIPPGAPDYGPFESRNTFPFIVNVCIGLALGVLASRARKSPAILHDAPLLWLFASIALMGTAVAFSFSRGGVLSLLAAVALGAFAAVRLGKQRSTLGTLAWLVPIILLASAAFFWSALENRFEKLLQSSGDFNARYTVWRDSLRLLPGSPVFGTGNGSFRVVEPIARQTEGMEDLAYDNAHNEYVEALVEGGVIRLMLTLALLATITVAGLRNYRHFADRSFGWLILGGLVGLWAVALHSVVDFGIHYPAVALLTAVVAAHVAGARLTDAPTDQIRLPAALALLFAAGLVGIGAALFRGALRDQRAYLHHEAALREADDASVAGARREIAHLQTATLLRPASHEYLHELSLAHSRLATLANPEEAAEALQESARAARSARNLSPAYAPPHSRLALLRNRFDHAPSTLWYLERALRSASTDPAVWYACGKQRFEDGDVEGACRDWRRALELRSSYLDLILPLAKTRLTAAQFLEKVLPARPELIYGLVTRMERDFSVPLERTASYLRHALALLEQRGGDRNAAEELLRGQVLRDLGRRSDSIEPFRRALALDSSLIEARRNLSRLLFELARELDDKSLFLEAQKETSTLLTRDPYNTEARERLAVIERELLLLD